MTEQPSTARGAEPMSSEMGSGDLYLDAMRRLRVSPRVLAAAERAHEELGDEPENASVMSKLSLLPSASDVLDALTDVAVADHRADVGKTDDKVEQLISQAALEADGRREDLLIEIGKRLSAIRRLTAWSGLEVLEVAGCRDEIDDEAARGATDEKLELLLVVLEVMQATAEVVSNDSDGDPEWTALVLRAGAVLPHLRRGQKEEAINAARVTLRELTEAD